ncbi:MAG: hypothetical protein A2284_14160 [Deltaproteobacteria bacterium RIFOXYA12_FULL_61_11]|nr:MAG: hypothetical protein A2284_14160 [Deltaproteobacteria bacterium RIFOXYA12_FULL_61_11]
MRPLLLLSALLFLVSCGGATKHQPELGPYERGLKLVEKSQLNDKDYAEAMTCFEECLGTNPKDTRALNGIARLHLKQGKYDRARDTFERVLAIDPEDGFANSGVARILIKQERYSEARDYIGKKLEGERDPKKIAPLRLVLGTILLIEQEYDEALSHLQKVLEIDINAEYYKEALLKIAVIHIKKGDKDKARLILLNYTSNKGDDPRIDLILGTLFVQEDKISEAISLFKKALETDNSLVEAYLNLSSIYLRYSNYPAALELCNQGLQYAPANEDLLCCKAIATIHTGNTDEGLEDLRKLNLRGTRPEISYELGVAYWKTGRLPEALSSFNAYKIEAPKPDKVVDEYIAMIERAIQEIEEERRQAAEAQRRSQEGGAKQGEAPPPQDAPPPEDEAP